MDIKKLSDELDGMIEAGKMEEAFLKYYAEDCAMQENDDAPIVGKATNLEREKKNWAMVEKMQAKRIHSAADGDVSYSEWQFGIQYPGKPLINAIQIARRQWKDGKIVRERFYHK